MVSERILEQARNFHGHVCPYLVLGLRASEIAFARLGITRVGVAETMGEDVVAIVEANNCFADGVQVFTHCTLGNNSLIYLDVGKTALTVFRRGERRGMRVYVVSERVRELISKLPGVDELWRRVVERRGSKEDAERLHEAFERLGREMLNLPEDFFKISEVEIVEDLERAPIFESVECESCGELVWKPRAVYVDGKAYCPICAGVPVQAVVGRGISTVKVPFREVR
jgi:formylmethanofuran dehydrogenase subunit E